MSETWIQFVAPRAGETARARPPIVRAKAAIPDPAAYRHPLAVWPADDATPEQKDAWLRAVCDSAGWDYEEMVDLGAIGDGTASPEVFERVMTRASARMGGILRAQGAP